MSGGGSHRLTQVRTGRLVSRGRVTYPLAAFCLVTVWLLATVPGGSVRGFEPTTDATALDVAGRSAVAVVGYVDLGQRHLYVTAESVIAVGIASRLATRGGVATVAGVVLGAGATAWLVVVTGCPCGVGSATPLWQLVT